MSTLSKQQNYVLAALIALPGFGFAAANATADVADAASSSTVLAAVTLSSAVAGGVAARPSRVTYAVAVVWSAFSVVFEILQARGHLAGGADARAAVSLGLGGVRAAGLIISALGLKKASEKPEV